MYGSEARILLHIWDYVFRDGYVILPFRVLTRDDINRINNYTLRMKLVYRGVDSSKNPVVDFIKGMVDFSHNRILVKNVTDGHCANLRSCRYEVNCVTW
jgi:hypothetical protein